MCSPPVGPKKVVDRRSLNKLLIICGDLGVKNLAQPVPTTNWMGIRRLVRTEDQKEILAVIQYL